jgi:EAL and modified HD-GYP domain-containing signal transduction protein
MSGKKLSPSQLAVMELMTLVTSDADNRKSNAPSSATCRWR